MVIRASASTAIRSPVETAGASGAAAGVAGQCGYRRVSGGRVQQLCDERVRRRQHRGVGGRQRLVVHAPAVMDILVERAVDHLRLRPFSAAGLLQGAAEVDPVERQDDIGLAHQRAGIGTDEQAGREGVGRVQGGEHGAVLEIGQHPRAQPLDQRHPPVPVRKLVGHAADHQQWPLRRLQRGGRGRHHRLPRFRRRRRAESLQRNGGRRRLQPLLLQGRVQANIGRDPSAG